MAGSNKYSYYSSFTNDNFSQDQPVNTDWFDEVTRTGHTQNNIRFRINRKYKVLFQCRKL
jgi:hypothetical protein